MSWIDDLIDENKGMKGPYNEQVSPVRTPANPSGIGTGGTPPPGGVHQPNDIFNAFLQILGEAMRPSPETTRLQNNVMFGRHLDMSGNDINDPAHDPFHNGTFQSAGDRYNEMANHTGAYAPSGYQGQVADVRNAQQAGRVTPSPKFAQYFTGGTANPSSHYMPARRGTLSPETLAWEQANGFKPIDYSHLIPNKKFR